MKISMLKGAIAIGVVTVSASFVPGDHAVHASRAEASLPTVAGLPTPATAQAVLTSSLAVRHPEWIDVTSGATTVRTFVVYPDRATAAPVVFVTAKNQGLTNWLRAVGDQVAAEGFIAIVPDALTSAVRERGINMPGSNGNTVTIRFDFAGAGNIEAELDARNGDKQVARFALAEHAWHQALAFAGRADALPANTAADQEAAGGRAGGGRGDAPAGGQAGGNCGMNCKAPNLPANFLMAATTVAHSPRKGEWVDIPHGSTKIHTWVTYPEGGNKAPLIVVIHPGPGMDAGEPPTPGGGANWVRAIADQLAQEGFIALVPDFTSGLGPKGGNFDSFQFPDEVGRALNQRSPAEQLAILKDVRDFGLKLPRANGKTTTIGFCWGGGVSWSAAAELPGLNGAVVFYGAPPADAQMAKIAAPVIAFYGQNDLGLAPRIQPGADAMKRLNKPFEVHVYEKATHAFLYRQDLGENLKATEDAWPRAIAFLKQHAG